MTLGCVWLNIARHCSAGQGCHVGLCRIEIPGPAASGHLDRVSTLSGLETETDALSRVPAHRRCWLNCGEAAGNMRSP
jgi:hypothetical protein